MKNYKIAVGGMIASGKSTIVNSIVKNFPEFTKIDEFEKDDEVFNTLLKWLYEGKEDTEMLLQVYFLHKHWKSQKSAMNTNHVVDRHSVEHWLFAQINMKHMPQVLNMYNGLYHAYMNDIQQPSLYVIIDINFETFKKHIFKRNRPQEIENFDKNEEYFKMLLKNYVPMITAQCTIYQIPYIVIDGNKSIEDLEKDVMKSIREKINE